MTIKPLEYNDKVTDEFCELITKYTVQLFAYNKVSRNNYQHIASSVLLKYDNKFFLLTAGHALKWYKDKGLGILEDRRYHDINGKYSLTLDRDQINLNKYEDIGIIELDDISRDFFKKHYDFLDIRYTDTNHKISNTLNYLIYGYPIEKTKFNEEGNKLFVIGWKFLTTGLSSEDLLDFGLKTDNICLFHYDQNDIINLKTGKFDKSPILEGLSGCGIWYLPELYFEKGALKHPYLIGINFGHDKDCKYVFGHKMGYILECIERIK